MPKIPDRKGEDILDFLQREGFFQKAKTKELLKEGQIKVNGKVMKKETYKPKKGDVFEIPPWTFTVKS
jgi:16S rRNA U516 pseudouridylate synthase RsuA-like enzyme